MGSYYEDPDKLTFDRAESLVDRFIRQYDRMGKRVDCKDVANEYDVEHTHHNLIRLNSALSDRLEVAKESSTKATQYSLETDEKRTRTSQRRETE